MISAFGVDHGYDRLAKAAGAERRASDRRPQPPASGGRLAAGTLFSPVHGLVAGRKGRKLRAAGNEWAGATLGGVAGTAVGLAARNPQLASSLGLGGGIGGAMAGVTRAQRKGHFKPQQNRSA